MAMSSLQELISPAVELIHYSRLLSFFVLVGSVCVVTRLVTSIQYSRSTRKQGLIEAGVFPYWFPYLGHAPNFALDFDGILQKGRDSTKDGMFTLTMLGKKHQFITMPSMVKAFFTKGSAIISSDEFLYWIHEKYFDDHGATRQLPPDVYLDKVHRALSSLMREPDLSNITDRTRQSCADRAQYLVPLSYGKSEDTLWSTAARASPIDKTHTEADLFPLIMNFVGDISGTALMGQAFIDNYPRVLEDLWTFDMSFGKLLSGMPGITPGIRKAKAARDRLKGGLREWSDAIMASQTGTDPSFKYRDLSDVSDTMKTRTAKFREANATPDAYVAGNLAVFWGMMVNANKVIFWMLINVAANPSLQSKLRSEITPYVKGWKGQNPAHATPLDIDVDGLTKHCPMLKATFYETMRLYTAGTSYKRVLQPLDLSESREDAANFGKDSPKSYHIAQGTYLAISHATMQTDPRLWEDVDTFNPKRFLVPDDKEPGGSRADLLHLTPFGGGQASCKGRLFAEREVYVFVSAILAVWDIQPAGTEGWKIPGKFYVGTGSANPKSNVRVRFARRS